MGKSTSQQAEAARLRQDIRSLLRSEVRKAIEITLEEERGGPHPSDTFQPQLRWDPGS